MSANRCNFDETEYILFLIKNDEYVKKTTKI